MILDFGDKYFLECFVKDEKPFIKLRGVYYTINYSSSVNEERTYLNKGFLAFKFLDFSSDIVLVNCNKHFSEDGKELLVSFRDNCEREIFIYFNLITGDVGYEIS